MAVTTNDSIKALLKVYYKDGVENLMFRNSPVLKKLQKNRIEGKTYNFSAMYGRGGAVAGDFTKAKSLAASVSKNVEFAVEPGQVFSVYTMNAKEVQASVTRRGAYMKVAGAKMFAASEGFRKTLAAALYGRGFGELCFAPASVELTQDTAASITLPMDAILKIDVGSELVIKTSVAGDASSVKATLTVNSINGTSVNVTPSATYETAATDVICLAGSMDASGNALLPVGLGGWLPAVAKRTGGTWTSYIGTKFFDVTRSAAPDRLAGAFYAETSSTAKKADAVQALLMQVRRQGSLADIIVLNDEDWLAMSAEIATSNTYFTQTSTKEAKKASIGFGDFSASFSTNYIENIVDDPYCPKGEFFILDSTAVEFDTLTNTDKVADGVAGNEPGKPDPMSDENDGHENDPYKLIIDDYINVQAGTADVNGPCSEVTLMLFGTFAVTNPSNCGHGLFYGANPVSISA
jgi:hypothetical protein